MVTTEEMLPLSRGLEEVRQTLRQGRPLGDTQLQALADEDDVLSLGVLADEVAARRWRGKVHFSAPMRLPMVPTCAEDCKVCASWSLTGRFDVEALANAVLTSAPPEVHLVSPHDRLEADVDWCERLVRTIRRVRPTVWIQGFTPSQIASLGGDVEATLKRLQVAGLNAMLGGDEEIFTSRGRLLACCPPSEEIHAAAHRAGLVSTATLRYGPRTRRGEIVHRLAALRRAQQQTGGFSSFVPVPEEIETGSHLRQSESGCEDVVVSALARLVLDNVPHVRAPWTALGLKMGQVALSFGADDLGWAPLDPHVRAFSHPATFLALTRGEVERLAEAAGRAAVLVDGAWREVTMP